MCIKKPGVSGTVLTNSTKSDKIKSVNEETGMKKILWVSRHTITKEQSDDLKKIYGETQIIQYDKTVTDVKAILGNDIDVYAVVLPVNLISDLRKSTDSEIIQSVSGRVSTGRTDVNNETEYIFKHLYWQKIIKFDIETERL